MDPPVVSGTRCDPGELLHHVPVLFCLVAVFTFSSHNQQFRHINDLFANKSQQQKQACLFIPKDEEPVEKRR
jgi:hypothetical protein